MNEAAVQDDLVISLEYTLRVAGEVLDTSVGDEPIQFIQGHGHIIPGLEKALYGMRTGDNKEVVLQAKDGYGEYDPQAQATVDRSEVSEDGELSVDEEIEIEDDDGNVSLARIVKIEGDEVMLDFNHPLAGKELAFTVTVVDLRPASTDELAHGHVHGPHAH
ncbi:MAG TPA: peptidylprolyl isomerase [Anaerolineales bacterium]|nr:peptidylprolyl isomerase [Anaerolineales bacterium]